MKSRLLPVLLAVLVGAVIIGGSELGMPSARASEEMTQAAPPTARPSVIPTRIPEQQPCVAVTLTPGSGSDAPPTPDAGCMKAPVLSGSTRRLSISEGDAVIPFPPDGPCAQATATCAAFIPVSFADGWYFDASRVRIPQRAGPGSGPCDPQRMRPDQLASGCSVVVAHDEFDVPVARAHPGDTCRGSGVRIGQELRAKPLPRPHVIDIAEIVVDLPWNVFPGDVETLGWLAATQDGTTWWLVNPNSNIGIGISRHKRLGVINDRLREIVPLPHSSWGFDPFNVAENVAVGIDDWIGGGRIHTRGCFTKPWNGESE